MDGQTDSKECAWCGTDFRLEYIVNGAWSIEYLCKQCYMEMVEEAAENGKDFGIHNPTYPLQVRER
jgi:hypothetical protein